MRKKILGIAAALSAAAVAIAGCGGGGNGSGNNAGGQANTVTIGLLTPTTGDASSGYVGAVQGAQGRIDKANAEHVLGPNTTIKLEVGDDASSPGGALKAAQDLVQNKHVAAVISYSPFMYGAYRYLQQQKIPVVGSDHDGPEWGSTDNMFAMEGNIDAKYPAPTTWGEVLKSLGATNVALLGYGASPSSTANIKNWQASAGAAGIGTPYVNLSIPFGSTDFGSPSVAIKNANANAIYASMVANSNYSLLGALRQQGVALKAAVLPTGYGQTLLDNKTALEAAEGASYYTIFKPVEVNDAASQQWRADLQKYANFSGVPTFGLGGAWIATDAMVAGLAKVQGAANPQSIMAAMKTVSGYTANGLLAQPRNFGEQQPMALGTSVGNCVFVSTVKGGKFVPANNGQPFCGSIIPNTNANP